MAVRVKMVKDMLDTNRRVAAATRRRLEEARVFMVNLMSAPGSGKTTLVEKFLRSQPVDSLRVGVVEGDIRGSLDAARIEACGVPVVQLNTGDACHLDAAMVAGALDELPLDELDMVIVENVGNLVCPAEFDVGEDLKAMVVSVAEGDDKPTKYPLMFMESRAVIVNKVDLLPFTDFDKGRFVERLKEVNPDTLLFWVSAKTGEGLDSCFGWLSSLAASKRSGRGFNMVR